MQDFIYFACVFPDNNYVHFIERIQLMHKPLLMIPGPMDPPDEVLRLCGLPVIPHFEGDFPAFYDTLVSNMKKVFGLQNGYAFIPNGSGTLAVNMMIASLCTPEDDVLVIDNGFLGEYAEWNFSNYGIPTTHVHGEWGTAVDPEKVRDEMKRKRRRFIYMTHNESSTAMVNPIAPIGEIAREFDALLLVDGVSSVGGVVVDMDNSGADVVAAGSQKCLELPPGLAPVAVSERVLDYMKGMKNRRVPYILDFLIWKKYFDELHDYHPQPVTGATSLLRALGWVAERIVEEGIENREERFRKAGERLKAGLAEFGYSVITDPRYSSPVVTEFIPPKGILAEDIREYYIKEHDTMVGFGFRKDDAGTRLSFRVAHFGLAAQKDRIDHMIDITRQFEDVKSYWHKDTTGAEGVSRF